MWALIPLAHATGPTTPTDSTLAPAADLALGIDAFGAPPALGIAPLTVALPDAAPCGDAAPDCVEYRGAAGEQLERYVAAATANRQVLSEVLLAYEALRSEQLVVLRQARLYEASNTRLRRIADAAQDRLQSAERWRAIDGWVNRAAVVGLVAVAAADR